MPAEPQYQRVPTIVINGQLTSLFQEHWTKKIKKTLYKAQRGQSI